MAAKRTTAIPVGERLASLETSLTAHTEADRAQFAAIVDQLRANTAMLTDLNHKMDRYKGFIGGVVFLVSAVWGVITLAVKLKLGG